MKKIFFVLLVFAIISSAAFAGDFSFAFEDARFHSDLLWGFAPVYVRAGVDYTGFELIEDQLTDFYIIGGGALISSTLWTDQDGLPTNAPGSIYEDPLTDAFSDNNSYSKWQGDFSLKLKQGFIQEPGRSKALVAAYAKYAFHWTDPHENPFGGVNSTFIDDDSSITAYPDSAGTATNVLQAGFEIDRLDKTDVYNGFNVDGSVLWAPQWLLNDLYGTSSFVNLNLTGKGYLSLLELKRKDSDLTLVGIYLADRVQVDYLAGSAIPQFYQESPALGSKMRGFEGNSLGTEFTVVNNFDIRFYGTEFLNNINPVIQLFFDTGFQAGKYYNTDYAPQGKFLCSTGFEIALNIIDFAQVGYMFGFPLVGNNIKNEVMQSGIMFQYKF